MVVLENYYTRSPVFKSNLHSLYIHAGNFRTTMLSFDKFIVFGGPIPMYGIRKFVVIGYLLYGVTLAEVGATISAYPL